MGNAESFQASERGDATLADRPYTPPATESAPRLPSPREIAHALTLRRRSSLKRRSASFLEAPVVHKATECGEAAVTVKGERKNKAGHAHKLRYAVSEMQGWRSHMEDEHLLNPPLALADHHLFAVFDGHGGAYASAFCSEYFVATLTEQREWRDYGDRAPASRGTVAGLALLKAALAATFLALDAKLRAARRALPGTTFPGNVAVPAERSGSTGVVVLVTPSHVLCANAGDSRALLARRPTADEDGPGAVLPLSFDHKPSNDVEVARVERDGGFVKARRVDGVLAVSRGFGDFDYKHSAGDEAWGAWASASDRSRDHRVTVHPDILVHPRDPASDDFVVLACDGIWDQLTNRDCAGLVRTLRDVAGEGRKGRTAAAGRVVEGVLDAALARGSRDNMTCCLVLFPQGGKAVHANTAPEGVNEVTKRAKKPKVPFPSGPTPTAAESSTSPPTTKPIPSQPLESVPQPGLPSNKTPTESETCVRPLQARQGGEANGPAPQATASPGQVAANPPPPQCKKHKAVHVPPAASEKIGRARSFKSLHSKLSRVRSRQ